jgi:hypothetical protein
VSHRAERKEKDCLNCGAVVHGKYCHICGQENVVPKETFWHLVTHFVYDVTHFDGKFFYTVKYLLLRPGYLSAEYASGRRASYLNPIKMYVFTSAFFFLFYFSFVKSDELLKIDGKNATAAQVRTILDSNKTAIQNKLEKTKDEPTKAELLKRLQSTNEDLALLKTDTSHIDSLNLYKDQFDALAAEAEDNYNTIAEYEFAQRALPAGKRDGWVVNYIQRKFILLKARFGNSSSQIISAILEKFSHTIPQLLFVSLPLVALLLRLLYVRRKQYYYADHIIYTVHLYCALFILIFLRILAGFGKELSYLHWLKYIGYFIVAYCFWYLYKSMRNFYLQRRTKTIFKFSLLLFCSWILFAILFVGFFLLSAITV